MSVELNRRFMIREQLMRLGINPYPQKVHYTHSIPQIVANNSISMRYNDEIRTVGRVFNVRRHGGSAFIDLVDEGCRLQAYLRRDILRESFENFLRYVDRGDFLLVEGTLFFTKSGELTILVRNFSIISKALRDPPAKINDFGEMHGGLKDVEERYRKRYLDILVNPKARSTLILKSKMIMEIRRFMEEKGFIECFTPILQPLYGGASAKPFKTMVNDLSEEWYLRISPELYLKRLIIGGINKVYEIGPNFRNESITTRHNPEFLMMEAYEAYADYNDMMVLAEELISTVAMKTLGTTQLRFNGNEISLKPPWPRITMYDAIKRFGGYEVQSMSDEEIQEAIQKLGIVLNSGYNRGIAINEIFEKVCEQHLIQPTFIIDYPRQTSPLCKVHRNDPELIERFELYIGGMEIANAYTELNDPVVQEQLFQEQKRLSAQSCLESHPFDMDFVEAMAYGMPPCGGIGLGVDRLAMILTDSWSIKEVIPFPMVKAEKGSRPISPSW